MQAKTASDCQARLSDVTRHGQAVEYTGVWNWAIRKIEQDAKDGIYYSQKAFHNLLADHGKKLGIPSHTLQGKLDTAYTAWQRCYRKLAKKPRLKGQRNKLTSIPFPDPCKTPEGTRLHVPGICHVRFHAQHLPQGRIKSGRLVKRPSGWYLCLCIDTQPQTIAHTRDPPRPAQHVGASPVPLATRACQ